MPMTLLFTDPLATELAASGGKGASLSKSAQSLPVPPGFVITASAYIDFLAPLQPLIADALQGDVDAASATIMAAIRGTGIPDSWRAEVEAAVAECGLGGHGVAVRSSGTLEDLPGAAFAGQHDTYLGVRGIEAILNAVRECCASLWNAHAMHYRNRLGVDHVDAAMAVVVQMMVDVSSEEAAGVAFSVDPVRGNLNEVLINAAFGLGETVVGGEEPVDEYRLAREGGEVAAEVVTKPRALVSNPAGGTTSVDLGAAHANSPALTPEQRAEVAELAVIAERHFNFPQDIEWAFSGGNLYLLQSRPVTRVAARWTRDESAERFPTPVTPLTWDLCEAGFHASLNHSFDLMGLPPFGDKWFAMRDNYIYGNQTAVELYAGRLPLGMLSSVETISSSLSQIAEQFGWVQELPRQWMRDLDTYLIGIGSLTNEPLEDAEIAQVWDHALRINDLGTAYFLPNIAISLTQQTLYAGLQHMLKLALDDDQARVVFERLTASTDTKTSQVNAELWGLSRLIRADADLHAALTASPGPQGLAQIDTFPAFADAFTRFLQRHGHRELDFDAYHPTWVEAPHIVLDQVRLLADREGESHTGDHQRKALQAETELAVINGAPDHLRYFASEVIRLAREFTALDDLEHYQTTRLTLPMRRALREIGSRLVTAGVLDEPMDVFFIPFEPLNAALRPAGGQTPDEASFAGLRETAYEHKTRYQQAVASNPDWVYGESAAPLDESDSIRGTAGSPGEVEGEVFVVHGPEDFASFPNGAILVARTTNPAWTALFYQASGVITESGGALSHGAVTARELGLPAVMAVREATSRFVSGERVRINGSAGLVSRI